MEENKDTHSYKGWLNSDSFLKRAFGVFGYYLVASLSVSLVVILIAVLLGVSLSELA